MKKKQVVLEVLAGHIDVVVFDGAREESVKRLSINEEEDALEWAKTLRRSAVSLRTLVEEMGVAGAETAVLYRSPTQSIDLTGFPVRSPAQAVEAAVLGAADSLPYSMMSAVTGAAVVGRDSAGEQPHTHVLVAAEREDIAEAIVFLVEEAGLEFVSSTLMDAAVIAGFVGEELGNKSAHRGSLYVGEQTSFFVVSRDGRLLFNRRIDLGLESLASSLTRPIIVPGRPEAIELSIDDARKTLLTHGVPDRDAVIDEKLGLKGGQILPLIQPVLQRFIVELRQSLRFGLDEKDREDLVIMATGPGSSIPGLAPLIAEELRVACDTDERYRSGGHWWEPGAGVGELSDALRNRRMLDRLNLLPRNLARKRRTGRIRRWLWTGAAAAIAVVAVDGVRFHGQLSGARKESAAYAASLAELDALKIKGDELRAVFTAKGELERAIDVQIGTRVDLRSCMQELSRLTPETIRFTSVQFQRDGRNMLTTLRGCAFDDTDEPGRNDLEPFIGVLQDSPLFDRVVLGNVFKGAIGDRDGQQFDATFVAVGVPWGSETVAQVQEEDAP